MARSQGVRANVPYDTQDSACVVYASGLRLVPVPTHVSRPGWGGGQLDRCFVRGGNLNYPIHFIDVSDIAFPKPHPVSQRKSA